ncbi:MAG: TrmH family RNA methyltransferase [Oscillospiraceae bacterium]
MKKLGASREYRRLCGEFLCDGRKLLEEAVKWHAQVRWVFTCGDIPEDLPESARVFTVSREVIEAVSPLKTPQDIVFSVGMPEAEHCPRISGAVILENMQDPGNVGTMIRTANAFGIKNVVLVGACADPWSAKTVRATMGAIFRQHISEMSIDELRAKSQDTPVIGAALSDDAGDLRKMELTGCAVAIGNEGNGLSDELLSLCAGRLIIPMRPECESLNAAAAAAVIMWEMARNSI